jgi:hypothetical protein
MTKFLITPFLIGGSLVAWLLFATPAAADTIYVWRDGQGIRHFSNLKPPPGVTQFSILATRVATSPCDGSTERRRSYDQMVEEYQRQARQMESQRQQELEKQAAQRLLDRQNRLDGQFFRPRRQTLEVHLQPPRRRTVSPAYSPGIRSDRIQTPGAAVQIAKRSGSLFGHR